MSLRAGNFSSTSLVLALRNQRWRAWAMVPPDKVIPVMDRPDDFWLVKEPERPVAVHFEPSCMKKDGEELRFTNFVQRSNNLPQPVNLTAVYSPLVQEICRQAVKEQDIKGSLNLYYLVHLNSHETFWSALPSEPFWIDGIRVVPIGYLDEMLLLLTGACIRISTISRRECFELYLIFAIHQIPTICRIICRFSNQKQTLIVDDILPVFALPRSIPRGSRGWAVLCMDQISTDPIAIVPFIQKMRESLPPADFLGELNPVSWEESLASLMLDTKHNQITLSELNFTDYFGFSNGSESSHMISAESPCFPLRISSAILAGRDQEQCGLTFFRGYFGQRQYCHCFEPIDLGIQQAARPWMINSVLESWEEARIECLAFDDIGKGESLRQRRLMKPPRLLRKETRQ